MKIALTGAGGFLGSEILNQLALDEEMEVLAFSSKGFLPSAGDFGSRLRVFSPEKAADPAMLEGADCLINCAFPRNNNGESLAAGMVYLDEVFRATASARVGSIVNVSSQSVYSQKRTEWATEETPLCLESEYAVAKLATELCLAAHCPSIPHTSIRLASLIGPRFNQRVVNKMAERALRTGEITVQSTSHSFGFFDVRDAARAFIVLAQSDASAWEERYVLGSDYACNLLEIAAEVRKSIACCTGMVCDIRVDAKDEEPTCTGCDSERFSRAFGWKQRFSFADTVCAIVEDLASQQ